MPLASPDERSRAGSASAIISLSQSENFNFPSSAGNIETDSLLVPVEVDVDGRVAYAQITDADPLQCFR